MVICIRQGFFLLLVPLFFVLSEFLPRYNSPFTFESREKCRRDWTVLFSHHSNANVSSCPIFFALPRLVKKSRQKRRADAHGVMLLLFDLHLLHHARTVLHGKSCNRAFAGDRCIHVAFFCARDLLLRRLAICTFAQKGGANILREAHSMRRRRRQLLFLPPPPPPTSLRV